MNGYGLIATIVQSIVSLAWPAAFVFGVCIFRARLTELLVNRRAKLTPNRRPILTPSGKGILAQSLRSYWIEAWEGKAASERALR